MSAHHTCISTPQQFGSKQNLEWTPRVRHLQSVLHMSYVACRLFRRLLSYWRTLGTDSSMSRNTAYHTPPALHALDDSLLVHVPFSTITPITTSLSFDHHH